MYISVSTANYFYLPFEEALEVIKRAGFQFIELDLFWEYENWAMAQHLKDKETSWVLDTIKDYGLQISSIHDGGGILYHPDSPAGHTNPLLQDYLDKLDGKVKEVILHAPHVKGIFDQNYWEKMYPQLVSELEIYQHKGCKLNIENMPDFAEFSMPLRTPQELLKFTSDYDLGVTLDIVHYAQTRMDYLQAARVLRKKVRTVHLSDYYQGRTHVLIGEGELDFKGFLTALDLKNLHSLTLECSAAFLNEDVSQLSKTEIIERVQTARKRLLSWLDEIKPDLEYQV